jgi:phage-related protein
MWWKASGCKADAGIQRRRVVEVVADHRGDTFRSVYTVRFAQAVFVLHVFQKKSKTGIATPRFEIEMIKNRLHEAERLARGER